jgi:hypothetical protein
MDKKIELILKNNQQRLKINYPEQSETSKLQKNSNFSQLQKIKIFKLANMHIEGEFVLFYLNFNDPYPNTFSHFQLCTVHLW